MAWVAPLTILIWIYAEREQVVTYPIQFIADVKGSDPTRVVTLLNSEGQPVFEGLQMSADFSGPHARLEELRDKLDSRNAAAPLQIPVPDGLPYGVQQIPATGVVNDSRVRSSGITVSNALPGSLKVMVDAVSWRDIPVQAPSRINTVTDAHFSPVRVRVTGPESLLREAEANHMLIAEASLDALNELKQTGPHENVPGVRVIMALHDRRVKVTPAEVTASFEVKPPVSYTFTTIQIYIMGQQPTLSRYALTKQPGLLPDVTVVGPQNQIDYLKEHPEFQPKAVLEITQDDVRTLGVPLTKPLRFLDLPDGVTVQGEQRTLTFELVDRKDSPDLPGT